MGLENADPVFEIIWGGAVRKEARAPSSVVRGGRAVLLSNTLPSWECQDSAGLGIGLSQLSVLCPMCLPGDLSVVSAPLPVCA